MTGAVCPRAMAAPPRRSIQLKNCESRSLFFIYSASYLLPDRKWARGNREKLQTPKSGVERNPRLQNSNSGSRKIGDQGQLMFDDRKLENCMREVIVSQ